MKNWMSPAEQMIREWAYDKNTTEPMQDWDLVLSWEWKADLYIELATDIDCPKSDYFIEVLYLMVGNIVRKKQEHNYCLIRELLDKTKGMKLAHIKIWRQKTKWLLQNPADNNSEEWYHNRYPYIKIT